MTTALIGRLNESCSEREKKTEGACVTAPGGCNGIGWCEWCWKRAKGKR